MSWKFDLADEHGHRAQHHFEIVVYRSNERFILSSVRSCIVLKKVKRYVKSHKVLSICRCGNVHVADGLDLTAFLCVMWWLDVSHRCGVEL